MPIQDNNLIMHGTRGMIGKQVVFKQWEGDTYLSAAPKQQKGLNSADELIEQGEAIAVDLPGNEGTLEVTV